MKKEDKIELEKIDNAIKELIKIGIVLGATAVVLNVLKEADII